MSILFLNILTLLAPTQSANNLFHLLFFVKMKGGLGGFLQTAQTWANAGVVLF